MRNYLTRDQYRINAARMLFKQAEPTQLTEKDLEALRYLNRCYSPQEELQQESDTQSPSSNLMPLPEPSRHF